MCVMTVPHEAKAAMVLSKYKVKDSLSHHELVAAAGPYQVLGRSWAAAAMYVWLNH
jgi:hypothetical protein